MAWIVVAGRTGTVGVGRKFASSQVAERNLVSMGRMRDTRREHIARRTGVVDRIVPVGKQVDLIGASAVNL